MFHRDIVEYVKKKFPVGTRVELVKMDDTHAPPVGMRGIVTLVDDIATIHVLWDNGQNLGSAWGEDIVKVVEDEF